MHPQQFFSAYDSSTPRADHQAFRFCPLCATPLRLQEDGDRPRPTCPNCNWVHYQNPAPCVAVLVIEGVQVLLGKRAEGGFAGGLWCLPGGFIEFDEDFLTAALREVLEETGLQIRVRSICNVVTNFLSPTLHTLVAVLLAEIIGGDPIPGEELVELAWFPLDGRLPEMAFAADRHAIQRYARTGEPGLPADPRYDRLPPP